MQILHFSLQGLEAANDLNLSMYGEPVPLYGKFVRTLLSLGSQGYKAPDLWREAIELWGGVVKVR